MLVLESDLSSVLGEIGWERESNERKVKEKSDIKGMTTHKIETAKDYNSIPKWQLWGAKLFKPPG